MLCHAMISYKFNGNMKPLFEIIDILNIVDTIDQND